MCRPLYVFCIKVFVRDNFKCEEVNSKIDLSQILMHQLNFQQILVYSL